MNKKEGKVCVYEYELKEGDYKIYHVSCIKEDREIKRYDKPKIKYCPFCGGKIKYIKSILFWKCKRRKHLFVA